MGNVEPFAAANADGLCQLCIKVKARFARKQRHAGSYGARRAGTLPSILFYAVSFAISSAALFARICAFSCMFP